MYKMKIASKCSKIPQKEGKGQTFSFFHRCYVYKISVYLLNVFGDVHRTERQINEHAFLIEKSEICLKNAQKAFFRPFLCNFCSFFDCFRGNKYLMISPTKLLDL